MAKKHSKFRNTIILFELLVRQIASDTLSDKDSKATNIIKEFFNKSTEMSKELSLYKTLLEDKFTSIHEAEKFLELVLEYRRKLNTKKLNEEKYNLVKRIKETYNVNDFFKARIQHYNTSAAIYMLFENTSITNPADIIKSKLNLVEHITRKNITIQDEQKSKIYEEFKQLDSDLRILTYKLMVDKFNNQFGSILNENQSELLKRYINNITDSTGLRDYINKQIPKIKEEINTHLSIIDDEVVKIKLNEVVEQLPTYLTGTIINEQHILTMMRYYQLVDELKRVA